MHAQTSSSRSIEQLRREHGDWTAMSIHLGDGLYTRPPVPDARLRRLVQIAADLAAKPLNELRVLDLACLEGHYGIEFALHGAEVVGIELREANLSKARFAQQHLNLDRLTLYQDDVRNLSVEKYGHFDVVICSGILYHLDVPDVFEFVQRIHEVCTRLAIFDTQIALSPRECVEFEGNQYHGLWYKEHEETADEATRSKDLWASVGNTRSFWLTHASLCNLMGHIGFSSFYECLNPYHSLAEDRRAYVAVKGRRASIRSSPPTDEMSLEQRPEQNPNASNPIQIERSAVFRFAKRTLPPGAKNMIKPVLRKMHILPPLPDVPWVKQNDQG